MKRLELSCLIVFVCLTVTLSPAFCDMVKVSDGSMLKGKIIRVAEGKLHIETSFAGEIQVPWSEVVSVKTEETLPIHLGDGSVIQGTLQTTEPGEVEVVWRQGKTTFPVAQEEIVSVNPPPPPTPTPAPKPEWEGKIVGNFSKTDGNTDLSSVAFTANGVRRAEFDRITLKAGYYFSEDEEDEIRNEQFGSAKYDYFITERLFSYLNARLDRDRIRDLDLRFTGGGGAGYQFYETDIFNFFSETGLSYVNEDFELEADDESYAAGRLAYHFDWWILKERLQLAQDVEFLLGFEDTEDWLAISTTSLSWKWNDYWSSEASVRYDYDNTPARDHDEEDIAYLLGIGLSF